MCGIAGCLLAPEADNAARQLVKQLFIANLLANEQRGKEATGMAICRNDGRSFTMKEPLPAHRFVKQPHVQQFLDQHLDGRAEIVLGHTREPTKGSTANNHNNHPIVIGDTVGVHNGVIKNDELVMARLARRCGRNQRRGEVDSQAIIALVDQLQELELFSYTQALRSVATELRGSFTCLFYHSRQPVRLVCLRYDNPISTYYAPELKTLFFSSRYLFLRKTFGRQVISPPMPARTAFVFESSTLTKAQARPLATVALEEKRMTL